MRNAFAIAWREVQAYFTSPLAYVVISVFLLLSGYIFWASLVRFSELCLRFGSNPYFSSQLNVNDMVVRPLFGTVAIILLFVVPFLTMRLLAEERRSGTAELLFTCPVTSGEVVLGKYMSVAFLLIVMLGGTVSFPLLILGSGASPDMKPTLIGYLGILMMGLALLSIGLLISAMTDSQIVAAVLTFGVSLFLWVLNWMADSATITLAAVMNKITVGLWEKLHLGLGGPTLGDLLGQISIIGHFDDFRKGILDTQHAVFYASVVFMCLFVTQRVLESRRWR
jgi:ABC-2 type transport system permease protein